MLQHRELISKKGDLWFRDIYTLANDPGPQMMLKLALKYCSNWSAKNSRTENGYPFCNEKKWNELKNLVNGFAPFFFL